MKIRPVGAARLRASLAKPNGEGEGDDEAADRALPDDLDGHLRSRRRAACLREQEPWSDLPIVLVSVPGEPQEARVRALKLLEPVGNIAILERPFQKRTLVSVFEAALRARRRQYQMRDAMGELLRAEQQRVKAEAVSLSVHALAKPALSRDKVLAGTNRIGRAADRMSRMIRDLLDLTRERQGGGIPIAPAPTDIEGIARGAVEEIQAASPDRRILLTIDGDMRGEWDPDRLSQVVTNLLGNAVAYSPPDTAVSVDLYAEGEGVVLSVHNLGDPIPPERMATLFDPFKRAPARGEREPARRGLGLGLFIADRIVRAHGGKVSVTSTAEDGTTFRVTLPRRRPVRTAEAAHLENLLAAVHESCA